MVIAGRPEDGDLLIRESDRRGRENLGGVEFAVHQVARDGEPQQAVGAGEVSDMIMGISNTIQTAESYTFNIWESTPLLSPFAGNGNYGNTQVL